jgi:hypothetical protein
VVLLFFDMKQERESQKKNKKNLFDNKLYIDEMDGGVYMDGHKIVKEKKKKICISVCTGIEILSMIK